MLDLDVNVPNILFAPNRHPYAGMVLSALDTIQVSIMRISKFWEWQGFIHLRVFLFLLLFESIYHTRTFAPTQIILRGCLHHGLWSCPKSLKNLWLVVELVMGLHWFTPRQKCLSDHGVQGPQVTNFKAYIIQWHDPTNIVMGEAKEVDPCINIINAGCWLHAFTYIPKQPRSRRNLKADYLKLVRYDFANHWINPKSIYLLQKTSNLKAHSNNQTNVFT